MNSERSIRIATEVLGLVASGVTVVIMVRMVVGPDRFRLLSMQAIKSAEDVCQAQAVSWATQANRFNDVYDSMRSVTL